MKKYRNSRQRGEWEGSRGGGALEEGPSAPSESLLFSSWPRGAAPQPRRSGVCVSVFPTKGLRSGNSRGNAGHGAAAAVTRRLAFFVDFLGLGLSRFIR